jgi:hypothetical protein
MTYLTLDELKETVEPAGFEGDDYFETHSEPEFDDLLQRLEKQSRAIINNQLMGEGYEEETGRVDTQRAPDKPELQLVYPVDDVSKVEIATVPDGDWEELETDLYSFDDQGLRLRKQLLLSEDEYWNILNPLRRESGRATWASIGDRVRVTYDRGYSTANVPLTIKEVQREIIRRQLTHIRQNQNLSNLSPDSIPEFNQREILTEDIKNRLSKITQTKNKYTMMR